VELFCLLFERYDSSGLLYTFAGSLVLHQPVFLSVKHLSETLAQQSYQVMAFSLLLLSKQKLTQPCLAC